MKMLKEYLKTKGAAAAAIAAFCAISAAVFALYRLPARAVGYAALLFLFPAAAMLLRGFLKFREKHLRLRSLAREIAVSLGDLPEPDGAIEEDYAELVRALFAAKALREGEMEREYAELQDYYTVWAHQIKTPIAAMRLMLQEGKEIDASEAAEQLRRVEQYVEMALGYLRAGADSTDFLIKRYDLDGIVRQAVRKHASQFIRRRIRLVYEPLNAAALTDEKWLVFVVEQLLSNALKYTRAGSVSISLEGEGVLKIADTGIGIAAEDLPRMFEKGFTGVNGRRDKKSTGIGLYLSKKILTKLGHAIWIESEAGRGTAVRIDLSTRELVVE